MATTSPTPLPAGPVRRSSQRQALKNYSLRNPLSRSESHPALGSDAAPRNKSKQYDEDSSEDEIPMPMKLSALTKALLSDGQADRIEQPLQKAPSPRRTRQRSNALNEASSGAGEERRHLRSGSVQASDAKTGKSETPSRVENGSARKRVVRLSSELQSLSQMQPGTRHSTSISRTTLRNRPSSRQDSREKQSEDDKELSRTDVNTPNHQQGARVVRIVTSSSGNRSRLGSTAPSSGRSFHERSVESKSALEHELDQPEAPDTASRQGPSGSISRYPSASTRERFDENGNIQSSMRIKRVGKISGNFLSGPARRGTIRRRHSGEEEGDNADGEHPIPQQPVDERPSFYGDDRPGFNSGSPVSGTAVARGGHRSRPTASNPDFKALSQRTSPKEQRQSESEAANPESLDPDPPIPHIKIPSGLDQENQVLGSYRGRKHPADLVLDKSQRRPLSIDNREQGHVSPDRKPLAVRDQNTPHRPAPPPPPKMSVLEAATSKAGAATTTQAKQRRNVLKVNGKCYTRLDCLGRGGTAKVYRVTAENGSMLALKRVSLENVDETTVAGYKGEIDLLGKLRGVDRVINLFDYEMNGEKKVLTLLMEMGELDLYTLLRSRQNTDTAKFDPVFVRFYWKEMLECLQSVHQHDIVHSDLKPANFVLVRGQLKLIDFGIANAIQTDETVNVHRETQIGTPNYMSPESLMDSNPRGRLPGRPKLVKLGKPSDIWSLGCILYQMVYGLPPFGHIANHMARFQAIINWDHAIEFPSRAMGGVPVPPSLLRTMKRCLHRDHHMRPTCEELLHETDPFLYPAEFNEKALPIDEEILSKIIQSVVTRCRERVPTEAESTNVWPQAYWSSIRKAMANRMK